MSVNSIAGMLSDLPTYRKRPALQGVSDIKDIWSVVNNLLLFPAIVPTH